jgi:hypothetical protein
VGKKFVLAVGIITRLQAGRSRVSNSGRVKRFYSSPERPDRFWGPPSLLLNGYRDFFPGLKRHGLILIADLYVVPNLRMSGAIPLLLPHDFITWTETILTYTSLNLGV